MNNIIVSILLILISPIPPKLREGSCPSAFKVYANSPSSSKRTSFIVHHPPYSIHVWNFDPILEQAEARCRIVVMVDDDALSAAYEPHKAASRPSENGLQVRAPLLANITDAYSTGTLFVE